MEFMGSRPIFNPPHVRDIMKEANTTFNPNCSNPKNPIYVSEYKNESIDLGVPFIDPQGFISRTNISAYNWDPLHGHQMLITFFMIPIIKKL
jgi:hypothetical protein